MRLCTPLQRWGVLLFFVSASLWLPGWSQDLTQEVGEVLLPPMQAHWPLQRSVIDTTRRFNGINSQNVAFTDDPTWGHKVTSFDQVL